MMNLLIGFEVPQGDALAIIVRGHAAIRCKYNSSLAARELLEEFPSGQLPHAHAARARVAEWIILADRSKPLPIRGDPEAVDSALLPLETAQLISRGNRS